MFGRPLCSRVPNLRGYTAPYLPPVLSSRAPEVPGTMLWVLVGAVLPVMLLAAPPPINKLALFPDKSAWCEAKNITQIVGHSGCEAKSIQNRWDSVGRKRVRTGTQGAKVKTAHPCLPSGDPPQCRLLPQGVPRTMLQLQRPQHLPAVHRVPGAL